MKRAKWPLVTAGFVFAGVVGYLLLRNWIKVEAHDLYIVGLVLLLIIFTSINRSLARSARELRSAVARADDSLAAARAAEDKYRSIFENAGEGIFQTDPDGRYLSANPALARLYGLTRRGNEPAAGLPEEHLFTVCRNLKRTGVVEDLFRFALFQVRMLRGICDITHDQNARVSVTSGSMTFASAVRHGSIHGRYVRFEIVGSVIGNYSGNSTHAAK